MERIVNGHYADPSSTRDIVGITPVEFEFLVRCIQMHHVSILKFMESSPEEQENLISQIAKSTLVQNENISIEEINESMKKMRTRFETDYGISYDFLRAINQPYPGAEY